MDMVEPRRKLCEELSPAEAETEEDSLVLTVDAAPFAACCWLKLAESLEVAVEGAAVAARLEMPEEAEL